MSQNSFLFFQVQKFIENQGLKKVDGLHRVTILFRRYYIEGLVDAYKHSCPHFSPSLPSKNLTQPASPLAPSNLNSPSTLESSFLELRNLSQPKPNALHSPEKFLPPSLEISTLIADPRREVRITESTNEPSFPEQSKLLPLAPRIIFPDAPTHDILIFPDIPTHSICERDPHHQLGVLDESDLHIEFCEMECSTSRRKLKRTGKQPSGEVFSLRILFYSY
jgi:hypothetical protein